MPVKIALLGSTGSIGTQALDVISRFPDRFSIDLLAAGNNYRLLARQAKKYRPRAVVISNNDHYLSLRDELKDTGIDVHSGDDAIEILVSASEAELVIAAIVGYSGLKSTVAAVRQGKTVALANKETLVVAGEIITDLAKKSGSRLLPVDSEHSAIFQSLAGEDINSVEKITLTASGGPFLRKTIKELENVKPEDALKHPNWNMGDKVTIDSASLMNKGLEVIEARWLFGLNPEQIKVIIHQQSIIHSFVHFRDGSVKAQLGLPDMRIPIIYALGYPERLEADLPRLDFADYPEFTFIEPDTAKFRNLGLAYSALKSGGNMPCILNASNEIAVDAFLKGRIRFPQMADVVESALENIRYIAGPGLGDLEFSDKLAREYAAGFINKIRLKQ